MKEIPHPLQGREYSNLRLFEDFVNGKAGARDKGTEG